MIPRLRFIYKVDLGDFKMNYRISLRFSKFIATATVVLLVAQAQAISTAALRQGIPSLAPMLEQVTPAVVSIRVSKARPTSITITTKTLSRPMQLSTLVIPVAP